MNTKVLDKIEQKYMKKLPKFKVGDTIAVHTIVREGSKQRIQIFRGIVLAIKGSGTRKTFTVRKISQGIGVEKIFPLYSPNIEKIEVIKRGSVRRSKIYYMRERIGKLAMKINEGQLSEKELAELEAEMKELEMDVEAAEAEADSEEENKSEAEATDAEEATEAAKQEKAEDNK